MSSWISEHEHQAKKVYEEEIAELTTAMNQLKTNLDVLIRNEKSVVSKIQTVLKEQEYYWSSVDGLFGTGTVSAVKTFFSDLNKTFTTNDKSKLLTSIQSNLLDQRGECVAKDAPEIYVACFSLIK